MHETVAHYVQAAAAHRDALNQLHTIRAALGEADWLPIPERHKLLAEIRRQHAEVRGYEQVLGVEPTATCMAQALVDEILADMCHEDVPSNPEQLADAVVMVLARPGHPPLPDDYPVGMIHLPCLEPYLTRELVHHLVAESFAQQASVTGDLQ
ncbi:MAG: hypothetical protein FWF02_12985 [Micrococcales bacterium]|nr:hypothetical protein [Micrococcales bacterium]MCL2668589.1 hypothetical protein [Micrococcales bacterium]